MDLTHDRGLEALPCYYDRYPLLAFSRPASLPAKLRGPE